MRKLTPELKNEIIELIQKGLSSVEIAAKLGVSPAQVMAVKAHITMGTYGTERKIEKLTPELTKEEKLVILILLGFSDDEIVSLLNVNKNEISAYKAQLTIMEKYKNIIKKLRSILTEEE
jgi:DNA-binding NarL/FixJ family response regulator